MLIHVAMLCQLMANVGQTDNRNELSADSNCRFAGLT